MALPEDVYGSLVSLQHSLRQAGLPVADLPQYQSASHLFAFWLSHEAFLLMQHLHQLPDARRMGTSEEVAAATERFADRTQARLGVPMPPARPKSPLALLASWFSLAGRAVGGSNWCIHDAAGSRTPMDIFRHIGVSGGKELHMLCESALHETQYDPLSGVGSHLVKRK